MAVLRSLRKLYDLLRHLRFRQFGGEEYAGENTVLVIGWTTTGVKLDFGEHCVDTAVKFRSHALGATRSVRSFDGGIVFYY